MDIQEFFAMPAVSAALLLALALAVASVARWLVNRLVGSTEINDTLSQAEQSTGERPGMLRDSLGTLAFLVVFLLFVPGIFAILGVDAVGVPILGMLSSFWVHLPNIIGAAIIMAIGLIVARLARQLLVPLLDRVGINRVQERVGIHVDGNARLSVVLATVAYALILIPVAIAALQVLDIKAISEPAIAMLSGILLFIPSAIVGLLVAAVGLIVARVTAQVVERLVAGTGVDARVAAMMGGRMTSLSVSRITGVVVQALIATLFLIEAFEIANLDMLADMGESVIDFLPTATVAAAIAVVAFVASQAVSRALEANGMGAYALPARVIIVSVAAFMTLSQLGVAPAIVNTTFAALVIAAGVAAAIAFGMGGRGLAARMLHRWTNEEAPVEEDLTNVASHHAQPVEPSVPEMA